MNETLEKQIEEIRKTSKDKVQKRSKNFYWGTGDLCDRASLEARIESAKEAISIIDELLKENKRLKHVLKMSHKLINKYF
jgi:hypothetical protein